MRSLQTYFRHLFRALRDIHARDIVHRDVKPANFLFNPKDGPDGTGWGVLCDFGLAQVRNRRIQSHEASIVTNIGRSVSIILSVRNVCIHHPLANTHTGSTFPSHRTASKCWTASCRRYESGLMRGVRMWGTRRMTIGAYDPTAYFGWFSKAILVCRPRVKANRAGTRGFRAPEVLLKCESQTVGKSKSDQAKKRMTSDWTGIGSARCVVCRVYFACVFERQVPAVQFQR